MIKTTVDLVPLGIDEPELRQNLARIEIANTGQGTPARGEYVVRVYDKGGRLWKTGEVHDFPRKRLLAADLLYLALRATVGDRHGD